MWISPRVLLSSATILLLLLPQRPRAQELPSTQWIGSILQRAGVGAAPLMHGEADGNQTLSGPSQQSIVAHLDLSSTGATMELSSSGEKRTITYSALGGKTASNVHAPETLSLRTALLSRFLYFPVLALASMSQDSQYLVMAGGQEVLNGQNVYVITVASFVLNLDPDSTQPTPLMKLYVDPTSLQIIQRDDTVYDSKNTAYMRSMAYSDYRTVGAVQIPFRMIESINGQTVATTQWTSVSFSF